MPNYPNFSFFFLWNWLGFPDFGEILLVRYLQNFALRFCRYLVNRYLHDFRIAIIFCRKSRKKIVFAFLYWKVSFFYFFCYNSETVRWFVRKNLFFDKFVCYRFRYNFQQKWTTFQKLFWFALFNKLAFLTNYNFCFTKMSSKRKSHSFQQYG